MSTKQIRVKLVVALVAAVCALTVAVSPAQANSISIDFVSAVPDSGNFLYTYILRTGSDTFSTTTPAVLGGPSGTFFTLYDFVGYVAGSASVSGLLPNPPLGVAANWSISTPSTGVTPGGVIPNPADGSTNNVTFTYTGPLMVLTPGDHGTFTMRSTIGASQGSTIAWSGQDTSTADGNTDRSTGTVIGPVPEPGSLLLLGTGLVGLVGVLRRRNRQ